MCDTLGARLCSVCIDTYIFSVCVCCDKITFVVFFQRRVMELKRASLIVNPPQETPRDSLLLQPALPTNTSGSNSQMFDLQEFLSNFEPEGSPGVNRGDRQLSKLSLEFRASQQSMSQQSMSQHSMSQHSMSQHSKSNSSSIHSLPSQTSMSKEAAESSLPVIANPAALAGNFNNNNSNSNNSNSSVSIPQIVMSSTGSTTMVVDGSTVTTEIGDKKRNSVGLTSSTPNNTEKVREGGSTLSWGDASSIGSRSLSVSSSYTESSDKRKRNAKNLPPLPNGDSSKTKKGRSQSASGGTESKKSRFGKGSKKSGRGLFKKHFYKSSGNVLEELTEPPLVKKKFHNSASDLLDSAGRRGSNVIDSLSGLTDLSQKGEISNARLATKNPKKQDRLSLPSWGVASSGSQESLNNEHENLPTPVPSLSPQDNGHAPGTSQSDDEDSIWLEYGCV